jgi:hypothetical protein
LCAGNRVRASWTRVVEGAIASEGNSLLPFDSALSPQFSLLLKTHVCYSRLVAFAGSVSDSEDEPNLGGKLLYAGDLDRPGRALVIAGNIAGAATLAATADIDRQKQAVRDGVVDFLVTSLDEALRILKNEIRKRNTVAVCVSAAPEQIAREMLERGVQADLLREQFSSSAEEFESADVRPLSVFGQSGECVLTTWAVSSAPANWLPKVDAIALTCLEREDWSARRWLRLAPRYMGRMSPGVRLLVSDRGFAAAFVESVRQRMQCGEIGTQVQIEITDRTGVEDHQFAPEDADKQR